MEVVSQAIKMLYRIRLWLIVIPVLATLVAIQRTSNLERVFEVNTTLYTGIASGFSLENGLESSRTDWFSINNSMDNLISIVKSKNTLREVSFKLYAQHMIKGDSVKDNNYIKADNYRKLLQITPKEVRALIDTSSAEKTIENLKSYEKASPQNFVYGLFNWFHIHYSYSALSKIEVKRVFNSDMLEIKYSANDPGIAYNTLVLLSDEIVNQYALLRYGETNNVVDYFRAELEDLGYRLRASEDSLTDYYIQNRVINYDEQTKIISAQSRDYDLLYNESLLKYTASANLVKELEEKIKDQTKLIESNTLFIDKLNTVNRLTDQVARIEMYKKDSLSAYSSLLEDYRERLKVAESDLKRISNEVGEKKYTQEGILTTVYIEQWLNETINRTKALAELKVMEEVKRSMDDKYVMFSPIGSTLKRMEREIGFLEHSYLSTLQSLNTALMRQKTLQMTSATLKPINPPLFPVSPIPTARRLIVGSTFVGTFILLLTFFILLELLDRTVRDRNRAERLIPAKVLGAFPQKQTFRYRAYNSEYERIATSYLANSIVPYLNPVMKPDIINFISTDEHAGKSTLISLLNEYWTERGLRVRVISWHDTMTSESRDFILSSNLSQLYDYENEDIIIVEHKPVRYSAIPVGLLREASVNILAVRADKVWKDVDRIAFDRLKEQAEDSPLMIYLTNAKREAAESFLGLLPPYSARRNIFYRLMQFGFTSK
jgi:uncharacterized protein involved in exopolysaccharide biosynthesis